MKKTTTKQKHVELKNLGKESQKNIYAMLRLTDEILTDLDYVEANGGELSLMESFESHDFAHFGGKPSLAAMLRAYRHTPDLATWEKFRFNIQAMIELSLPEQEQRDVVRINWKAKVAELQDRLEQVESENERLVVRLKEMESMLDRFAPASKV